jgi:hypothetical protein
MFRKPGSIRYDTRLVVLTLHRGCYIQEIIYPLLFSSIYGGATEAIT